PGPHPLRRVLRRRLLVGAGGAGAGGRRLRRPPPAGAGGGVGAGRRGGPPRPPQRAAGARAGHRAGPARPPRPGVHGVRRGRARRGVRGGRRVQPAAVLRRGGDPARPGPGRRRMGAVPPAGGVGLPPPLRAAAARPVAAPPGAAQRGAHHVAAPPRAARARRHRGPGPPRAGRRPGPRGPRRRAARPAAGARGPPPPAAVGGGRPARAGGGVSAGPRVGVVVITHQRRPEVLHTLRRLRDLPERPPVVVVDNASTDGTADAVAAQHPEAALVRSPVNLGAVARNVGVEALDTPYVAFCDDDTWWEPGSLERAADLFDADPRLGCLTARILVAPEGREHPITPELRGSPLPGPPDLPGPVLLSVLAGASVFRVSAFTEAGGFSPRLWLGGEEELLSLDLAAAGWWMCWVEDMVVDHAASRVRG